MTANGSGRTTGAAPVAASASAPAPVRRLAYRKPWPIFLPIVACFVLLNYLVFSTETDDTGKWRILPDYVRDAAEQRDNAIRDHETPASDYMLYFEDVVMGFLFRLGVRMFGSMQGVQLVLAIAWMIHLFELGICVRICVSCNAPLLVALRYCFCTTTSGFTQLFPLMRARDEYVKARDAPTSAPAAGEKKNK